MPRFKLFARKQADGTSAFPTGEWHPAGAGSHPSAGTSAYDDLPGDPQEDDPLLAEAAGAGDPPTEQLFDDLSEPVVTGGARKYLDLVQPPPPEQTAAGAFDTVVRGIGMSVHSATIDLSRTWTTRQGLPALEVATSRLRSSQVSHVWFKFLAKFILMEFIVFEKKACNSFV